MSPRLHSRRYLSVSIDSIWSRQPQQQQQQPPQHASCLVEWCLNGHMLLLCARAMGIIVFTICSPYPLSMRVSHHKHYTLKSATHFNTTICVCVCVSAFKRIRGMIEPQAREYVSVYHRLVAAQCRAATATSSINRRPPGALGGINEVKCNRQNVRV